MSDEVRLDGGAVKVGITAVGVLGVTIVSSSASEQ
jgi:hypothetical protein